MREEECSQAVSGKGRELGSFSAKGFDRLRESSTCQPLAQTAAADPACLSLAEPRLGILCLPAMDFGCVRGTNTQQG